MFCSSRFAQHPVIDPRPVPADDFDPRGVLQIAEHKQRAALEVLPACSATKACSPLNPLRMSGAPTATNTFKLPEKLNMAWIAPARPLPPKPLVFHRPLPVEPRRATATPARCRSQPLAAIQQRLPQAVVEAAAPTVCRCHDCVSPSWPGLNILIQSAAQTGEVLSPLRTNAVRMSSAVVLFDTRSRPFRVRDH